MLTLEEVLVDFIQLSECKVETASECTKDCYGKTPLHWMAFLGDVEAIKLLISKDVNVDTVDNQGNSPLHIAVLNRQALASMCLLESGANSKLENNASETPIRLSVSEGFQPVLDVFKEYAVNE